LKSVPADFKHLQLISLLIPIIVAVVIETTFIKTYDLVEKFFLPIQEKIVLFSLLTFFILILQFFILRYLNKILNIKQTKQINSNLYYRISIFSIIILGIFFGLLIYQQFFFNYYNTSIVVLIIILIYGVASFFMLRLSLLFFSWYKSKPTLINFFYFVSMSLIVFNLIMTTTITTIKISERPSEIREFVGGSIDISVGRYITLDAIYKLSSFMSFVSLWITTLILLYRYKNNLLHTLAFILILSLPLIYFLISYSYEFIFGKLLVSFLMDDPITISIILTVLLSLSKPIGGLTFGFAFWRIAKTIGYEKTIKIHMIISGWGILLLFGTNQASNQVLVPYPPFGLATITVVILASYMMLLGIYNSARLVSVNSTLRKTIQKHTLESNLLESIGQAEMEYEIRKTVNSIIQDKDIIKMPIDTKLEFDKNELRKYIDSVITEVKHERNNKNNT
jgi:hypothetical protein